MLSIRMKTAGLLGVLVALSACGTVLRGVDPLEGTSWTLESIGSTVAPGDRAPTLEFSGGKARGSAGCNSFQGDYSSSSDKLNFSDLMMTLMACPDSEGVMELEQEYFAALQAAGQFELSEGRLSITTGDGKTLIFTAR